VSTPTTTEVRDRISAFLAGRDKFWSSQRTSEQGCSMWVRALTGVVVADGRVRVHRYGQESNILNLPADSPDLLERLGETLDGLGV
jgi:hypothetical protein